MPWTLVFKAFFVVLIITQTLVSQNKSTELIDAQDIKKITVNGNQIFNIEISTHNLAEIKIDSFFDGEYQDGYQIIATHVEETLTLQLEANPIVTINDDKRNAHKVLAAQLYMQVPSGINIEVLSDIGSVSAIGDFNSVNVQLLQGFCEITGSANEGIINTIDGHINLATRHAEVKAKSTYGKVSKEVFTTKKAMWQLTSIHGDITVTNHN